MNPTPRLHSLLKSTRLPLIGQFSPASHTSRILPLCLPTIRSIPSIPPIGISVRRYADSASSKRWQTRQANDPYTKAAKHEMMRSRAGFKLMQLNTEHDLLSPGMTVIDLGYAPGAWTEVALEYTKPNGRVIGVDMLPAVPPAGASTFQGNFLDEKVQLSIRQFLASNDRVKPLTATGHNYFGSEQKESEIETGSNGGGIDNVGKGTVDVVLSDMCEPWELVSGVWVNSIKNPYRLMNVSGVRFRDHIYSMDLCVSALLFAVDVLKGGGHFVCKYYSGNHDKELEAGLKKVFTKVSREKPPSSRSESREGYFVAKNMRFKVDKNEVLKVMPHLI